jgi:hypothetical protein
MIDLVDGDTFFQPCGIKLRYDQPWSQTSVLQISPILNQEMFFSFRQLAPDLTPFTKSHMTMK